MLPFQQPSVFQASKCFFTYATTGHLDPKQLPTQKKPWSTIASLDFIHTVDLILQQDCAAVVRQKLVDGREPPRFRRVVMKLSQILEGDFFKEYIKVGDILMLSEGRPGQDNVFTLKNGTLTMFLDRETYERAGLVGKPHGVKGKRGLKQRWVVEYDLRADWMWPSKKGFKRLLHACENALNTPLTWLFCSSSKTPDPDPLAPHFPTTYTSNPAVLENMSVALPPLEPPTSLLGKGDRIDADEFIEDIYEWLSLVRLESPRIETGDNIDPYLSCYQVPGGPEQQQPEAKLCKFSWRGFISPIWVRQMLVDIILTLPPKEWFSVSATTFSSSKGLTGDGAECTILQPPKAPGEFLMWEVKSHE